MALRLSVASRVRELELAGRSPFKMSATCMEMSKLNPKP